ncbi:MAG TPA: L-threonylcarbamoyladenylate synthase [Syntrophorhabdaceae bacterium]|nr:L-threonylcarbamoyladenylate synthase [Syntrophorhabdaceae bacterium]HOL05279.1 L-threonylcarbamoyladenylate synthase [Syntrophorhabdaceae bacterium]HPC66021.1 L-threonylcarbamoyladenylate synthase [Syntrophorhabdaceae bacterium]HPP41800.1 L-threonylcarbamoyladenylate synthase [Syntrophorhabdaceae bacterium]HQK45497.1 L-threonylcarbamoyladenylate synthase [Syntrophorhabdaceae bacterium]
MEILNGLDFSSILRAKQLLEKGGVVAFPTETVYGLGADALNPYAVAKIFEIKRRPRFDPLIVHIDRREWLEELSSNLPKKALLLTERFWPGPLTIILKKRPIIPDIVTAGLSTVGIRMPAHPVAQELIRSLNRPIAAPSANPFGYISPTMADHVAHMLKDRVEVILDGGKSVFGIESTIVSFLDDSVFINRHGAISAEEISDVIGPVLDAKDKGVCESPGSLPYHYSPHKPLKIVNSPLEIATEDSSFLSFKRPLIRVISRYVRILSEQGDLREAAANFFSYLIELDKKDVGIIYAERIPEKGLGKAIMERLKKASKKHTHTTL